LGNKADFKQRNLKLKEKESRMINATLYFTGYLFCFSQVQREKINHKNITGTRTK